MEGRGRLGPEAKSTAFQSMCWKAKVRDSALGTLGKHLLELSSTDLSLVVKLTGRGENQSQEIGL